MVAPTGYAAATPPGPAACHLARPRGDPRHYGSTATARYPAALAQPGGPGPVAYLATVISRGAAQLATMTDGHKHALFALAYDAGGLLEWSGLACEHVARFVESATVAHAVLTFVGGLRFPCGAGRCESTGLGPARH